MELPPQSHAPPKRPIGLRVRPWLAAKPVDDLQRDPRTLSLAFCLLFGSGGLLVLFTLLLPPSPDRYLPGLIGPAVAAIGLAAALLAAGRHCPIWVFRLLPLWGGLLVSIVSYSGGVTAAGSYAMFYFWVIISAFYFFPGWWGVANLASVAVEYAVVARLSGTATAELKWVMLMGTLVVAVLFLALLQDYAERATGERERLLARVEQLARTDPLTSLPNRRAWQDRLVEELGRAARQGTPLALVVMDLDGLKGINDVGGHAAGDRTIKLATTGWRRALRDSDFIARLGGDEFGALLPDCPEQTALGIVNRMREATPAVAWSAGIAVWDGKEHGRALLRRADAVLYEAKRDGRNRVRSAAPAAA